MTRPARSAVAAPVVVSKKRPVTRVAAPAPQAEEAAVTRVPARKMRAAPAARHVAPTAPPPKTPRATRVKNNSVSITELADPDSLETTIASDLPGSKSKMDQDGDVLDILVQSRR